LPPVLTIGDVRLTYLAWNADDAIEPLKHAVNSFRTVVPG